MEGILVKEYSEEYKEEIVNLILQIQQKEFEIPITKEDQPDLNEIPKFYQSGEGNFWVALSKNKVVGTISLIDIGNQQAALRKMFVKAAYRGSHYKVAELLLLTLIEWSREHTMREIYLGTTEKFSAAHRFYEKNRFVLVDKETLPDSFPLMKVDTRFYKYQL